MANAVEKAVSKIAGAAKQAKARTMGLSGVFARLSQEHGEVAVLLRRVKMSSDPDVRAKLFPEIRRELLGHERGELAAVYPVLRQYEQTRAMAEDHEREAQTLEQLLMRLDTGYDSREWESNFNLLVETVEHHVKEEENRYFPSAMKALGKERAEQLDESYRSAKEAAQNQVE